MRSTKVGKFTYREVPRSQIKTAAYNPRQMDAYAAQQLEDKLREVGLVEPLVWNERTGTLVGGHQRLAAIDRIEKGAGEFTVPVAVIDVDEKTEKELNVWLNNPSTQGTWDIAALAGLFTDGGADPFEAGFSDVDLNLMFPADAVEQMLDQWTAVDDGGQQTAPDAQGGAGAARPQVGLPSDTPTEQLTEDADEIALIKARRKSFQSGDREAVRADHMVCVVFDDSAEASRFLQTFGLDDKQQFIDSDRFLAALDAFYGATDDEDGDDATDGSDDPTPTED